MDKTPDKIADAQGAFEAGDYRRAYDLLHGNERAAEIRSILASLPETAATTAIYQAGEPDFGLEAELAKLAEALRAEQRGKSANVEGSTRKAAADLARRITSRRASADEDAARARRMHETFTGAALRIPVNLADDAATTAVSLHERLERIAAELRAAEAEAAILLAELPVTERDDPVLKFAYALAISFASEGFSLDGEKRGDGFKVTLRSIVESIDGAKVSEHRIDKACSEVVRWDADHIHTGSGGEFSGK